MKTKTPYNEALKTAQHIKDNLSPHCQRCEIVGSIRRKKPIVGDIEILCLPKLQLVPKSLFETKVVRHQDFVNFFKNWQPKTGQPVDGKYLKCQYGKIQVDIFIATADNYGLIKWLRTGSSGYNMNILMEFKRRGFKMEDGLLYKFNGRSYDFIPTSTEESFYKTIGIPLIAPELRTIQYNIPISKQS